MMGGGERHLGRMEILPGKREDKPDHNEGGEKNGLKIARTIYLP